MATLHLARRRLKLDRWLLTFDGTPTELRRFELLLAHRFLAGNWPYRLAGAPPRWSVPTYGGRLETLLAVLRDEPWLTVSLLPAAATALGEKS